MVDVLLGQVPDGAVPHPAVAEDPGVVGLVFQQLLGGQVVGHVKDEGDHGLGQHVLGHQGVPGKADIVRGDDADVVRGVARGAENPQLHPAEVDGRLPEGDDPVHGADEVLQPGDGAHHAHGEVEQVVFQALLAADDVRLQLGQAGLGAVGVPEVAGGLVVVVVHVGAHHPHRGEAGLLQGRLDPRPQLGGAGVEEQAGLLVDLVQAHQLGAFQDPGVSLDVGSFHGSSPVGSWVSSRSKWIIRAATSAGDTPEIRLAWPRLRGRRLASFCRASSRRPVRAW